VLQCCKKNGRGKGWLGQEQDPLPWWVESTRAGDYSAPLLYSLAHSYYGVPAVPVQYSLGGDDPSGPTGT
jgi:hypothetical protein